MIEISNLQKISDQGVTLNVEALAVKQGEIVTLVGPADSGKEILFDLLIGKSRPSAGTLRLGGVDPNKEKSLFSRRVGILFLEDGLYLRQSCQSNLDFQCQLYGLPKSRSLEVLAQIGMADQAPTHLDKMPSGLQRRLAFGRAILHKPQVLLLIEPFARCDEATISILGSLMRQLANAGTAVLILSDDMANLTSISDSLYTLNQGQLIEAYPSGETQQAPASFKIPVRLEDKVRLVNPADIMYAEAEGGHASLLTAEGRLPTQFTLSELEERLSRSGFFRAHRSYLVNLQHVKEVIPYTRNSYSLRLDDADNTEIPLSKSAASELRELLGY